MPHSFAAVDLGAQSGRVVLGTFGDDGFRLDEVHRFANVPRTVDGVLCWDAPALFTSTLDGLARAVLAADCLGSPITSIAVDSWGVDYGLVDVDDALVAPMRHYRASAESTVAVANASVRPREAYARTGITELAINTCFQFVRDARLGLLDSGPTALLTPDLWTCWLTGTRGAERTIASTTGLLDWSTGDWAADLMHRWGIPRSLVADLCDTGSSAGRTMPAVTSRLGSRSSIAVVRAPAHDTASAFAAVIGIDDDVAVVSCGTWALVGCVNHTPVLSEAAERAGFTNETAADGSALLVRNLSGTWLLEECVREWAERDGSTDLRALRDQLLLAAADDATRTLGTIDCGAAELIGTGSMTARIADLYRRTTGDTRNLDRAQVVRLVLDSLAASFAATIRQAGELTGRSWREVRMIGGGSRIAHLVVGTERATGLPVRVGHQEATSIGNICVQAVSAGLFDTIDQARRATEGVR